MKARIALWAVLCLAACDGCDGSANNTNNGGYDDPPDWAPVTKPPPDNCEGCPEVDLTGLGGHGADVLALQDPEVDDELVQWATCLNTFMSCLDTGETMDTCMRQAPCPSKCKDAYFAETRSLGELDFAPRADAVEKVFMNEGGICAVDGVAEAGHPVEVQP